MESDANPMHPVQRLRDAPRCSAKSKRSGAPCSAPAVSGWKVCRMHGACGGAPCGTGNGMWRHGGRSQDVADVRSMASELTRWARMLGGEV